MTPHSRLLLAPADDAVALSLDLSHRLQRVFARGSGHGLHRLGAAEVGTVLPPVLEYWREFGARYGSAVYGQQDLDASRSHTILEPPRPVEEKIDQLIESKQRLSQDLLEGGAETLLTEMNDEEWLRLVALDIRAVSRE
jgi:hypothetical protein